MALQVAMLLDNLFEPSHFVAASAQSSSLYPEYPLEFDDIFDSNDLFNNTFSVSSSSSPGSQGSSLQNLLTPPPEVLPTPFTEVYDEDTTNQFYALFNGFDGSYGATTGGSGIGHNMGMNMSNMAMSIPPIDNPMQMRSIDSQLLDNPSAIDDQDDELEEEPRTVADIVQKPQVKSTFIIAPVSVGGFGKARMGTVQSGGVVKKTPSPYVNKEKENPRSSIPPSYKEPAPSKFIKPSPTFLTRTTPLSGLFLTGDNSMTGGGKAGGSDDDDLPQDWRPPPEVLAKMTSREKRQLRNKISARNFRVRRKGSHQTLFPSLMT